MTTENSKVNTETQYLDFLQGGKMPREMSILFVGDARQSMLAVMAEFLDRGVSKADQTALFITFDDTPEEIIQSIKTFGWDYPKYVKEKKIVFLDASPSPDCEEIGACDTMSPLIARLKYALDQNKPHRVVIAGLHNMFNKISDKKLVREAIYRIVDILKEGGISYMISTDKSKNIRDSQLERYLAEATIELSSRKQDKQICQTIRVTRIRDREIRPMREDFEIGSSGLKICSSNTKAFLI